MGFWLDLWFYWMQISDLIRLRFALSRLQNFGAFSLFWQIDPCGSISAMCLRSTTYPCYNSELKARLMI
jgi:hypothetical protein